MKRNWFRNLAGGLSFTSALFVFQACYGTPQDFMPDLLIEGQVKSKSSGLPIEGIKVSVPDNMQHETTDAEGKFSFYTLFLENLKLRFEDIDSTQNGLYLDMDTTLTGITEDIFLEVMLEEK
jgi:hypothetical protein